MDKLWINNLVEFLKNIEKNNYIWTLRGFDNAKLSAAALFCKCSKIFENYHNFDFNKTYKIIKTYKSNNTFYIDKTNHRNNIIAETRQAISGLINTGYDDTFIDLNVYYNNEDNLYFMSDNNWNDPWGAGAQLSHYLFFLQLNPEQNKNKILNVLNKLEKYKKQDGWYYNRPNNHVRINGIMKVFTGLDIINYDYKNIEDLLKNIINSILILNPGSGGCNIYDYVYVLSKSKIINYRIDECKKKLINVYHLILTYQHPDGGFSYNKNSTTKNMYGKTITNGFNIGGIHGTTLMCMALSIIDNFCDLGLNLSLAIS